MWIFFNLYPLQYIKDENHIMGDEVRITITHGFNNPPPPLPPLASGYPASPSSFAHHLHSATNSHYSGKHRGIRGTNRHEMQQKRQETRLRLEAEEARTRANQEAHHRAEETRQRDHQAALNRLEVERLCAQKPLEGAQKWVNDAANNVNNMEHHKKSRRKFGA
ncbi:hypothetical protein ABK905_22510 [Acerihabitans sp. KWT182]|uniref:Uncharacterized protein n=1 Tax=Acerihabitans sp. KWT182 TaxID=3157919 RepID=A0AAU7Q7R7_9GAMM